MTGDIRIRNLSQVNVKFFILTLLFLLIMTVSSLIISSLTARDGHAASDNIDADINVTVADYIALAVTPTLNIAANVSSGPTLVKGHVIADVSTNAMGGYTLSMSAVTSNTNLTHTTVPSYVITNTTNMTPSFLTTTNTWGYNVGLSSATSTFKAVPGPAAPDVIASSAASVLNDQIPVTYGAYVDQGILAGTYQNNISFTAVTNEPPLITDCGDETYECILFSINTTDGTYSIPTSGFVTGSSNHAYNWDVYVDGVLTTDCPSGNCTGTSSTSSNGIVLTGLGIGTHQIKIVPHDNNPTPGWGNAFGYYSTTAGANVAANKDKIISIDAPLTTMAFMPKTTESITNANYMFANIFFDATNLTTPARLMNTYDLPASFTSLTNFASYIHRNNSTLTSPLDMSSMDTWLQDNTSIANLQSFLYNAQSGNTNMTTAIDLTPISGWFNANTSITNLSNFLNSAHPNNITLTRPIDLTPISGWFNANTSIINLSNFLSATYSSDTSLITPIDLTPLSGWFNANTSIINLSGFLDNAHSSDTSLATPIDLTPISGWFNANTSITNLSSFLMTVHGNSPNITAAIDVTPLSGWFTDNRSIANLAYFMAYMHQNNPNLRLSGQIVLPNWIKTLTSGSTPIIDVNPFAYAYRSISGTISGDTGEVRFEDGTVLSSLGTPSTNLNTYTNRSGITPLNPNWK